MKVPHCANRTRRILYGLIVAVLFLLLLEGLARLVNHALIRDQEEPGEDAMHSSDLLGWAPYQGESTAFGVPAPTWINTMGIRGPEPTERVPDELRLLTLGDSTVYGVNVGDDNVFSAVAAARLSRELGRPVRAFNGGIPGYSSEQSWRLLRYYLTDLDFDYLVIANLWSDCHPAPEPDRVIFPLHFAALPRTLRGLGLVRLLKFLIHGSTSPKKVGWEIEEEPSGCRVPLEEYPANLTRLADMARARGAEPVFLLLPSNRDLRREPLEATCSAYRDAMRAVANEQDALLVNGFAPFEGHSHRLMLDDVHPSAQGHRLLGETLAEALLPLMDR